MDCMLLKSHLWTDQDFLRLSRIGRLAYIELSRLCDDNWGHCCFKSLHALVMALCPDEAEAAAYGDTSAQETLAEVREQLELAAKIGLLIAEETVDGYAVGYAGWEKYTGKARRRRGKPRFAMGPRLAASRHWGTHQLSDRTANSAAFHDYATRLGILSIVDASRSTSLREIVEDTDGVVETKREVVDTEGGVVDYIRVPGSGFRVPGGERSSARDGEAEKQRSAEWPPCSCSMPPECVELVKRIGKRHPRQIVIDHNLRRELPGRFEDFRELTDCETWEEWCVACALMAAAENSGEWVKTSFDRAIRDHGCPSEQHRNEARRMLGLTQAADESTDAVKEARVMVCPTCGWEDATGTSRVCETHRRSELVPKGTQEDSPFAPGSPESAREASVVAELG